MHILSFMFLSAIAFVYSGNTAHSTSIPPVVCQNTKCYPATAALTRENLFNKIQNLIDNNLNQNVLLCEANPHSKMCLTKGFSLPLYSSSITTDIEFTSAKITSNTRIQNSTGSDLIVDYKTKSQNIFPTCQTAVSRLGVLDQNNIQIIAPDFSCNFGKTNQTTLSLNYLVDYINFDNGTIGAHYSIAAGQKFNGRKTGYVLFRFSQPVSIDKNESFPMPEALQNYQLEQQKVQTNLAPVWMKPTPVLNIETPEVITKPDGRMIINDQGQGQNQIPAQISQTTPSTTGLITQEKNILPPTSGLRKTVTIKKQIFQKGKPVVYEEDVRRYVQENENAPLIEEKKMQAQQKEELAVPQMPTPVNNLQNNQLPHLMPEYIFPHEVTLTKEEIEQIQTELPPEQTIAKVQPVQMPLNASLNTQENEPTGLKKFWNKIEKLFYF